MNELITDGKIRLRELEESDKPILLKWLTDERILNFWEGKSAVFDIDRINAQYYCKEEVEAIRAIIEFEGQSIGYVHMYNLDKTLMEEYEYPTTDKVVYGIDQFIGESEFWNRGIGTGFMKLVLKYLTDEKHADIVILDPHADNPRAIRCYEKVGFKEFGRQRQSRFVNGKYYDTIHMDILKSEFKNSFIKNKNI